MANEGTKIRGKNQKGCVIIIRRKYKRLHPCPCKFAILLPADLGDEEDLHTATHSLSTTDYINDPYHKYLGDVLEYIYALRECTSEGGISSAKSPIAEDLPKGLKEIKRPPSRLSISNSRIEELYQRFNG
ncbi:hypothetical protein KY284_001599 [Solanum tuberosum]|nr:hypothetical protein KY284_001599 [Solanum tuberosum]